MDRNISAQDTEIASHGLERIQQGIADLPLTPCLPAIKAVPVRQAEFASQPTSRQTHQAKRTPFTNRHMTPTPNIFGSPVTTAYDSRPAHVTPSDYSYAASHAQAANINK